MAKNVQTTTIDVYSLFEKGILSLRILLKLSNILNLELNVYLHSICLEYTCLGIIISK